MAGALYDGSPAPGARAALAAAFLNAFWPLYRAGPRSGYLDEYRRRQALTGQRVLVTPRRGTPRAAQVQGIDDECKLVVRFDGESRPAALNSGEMCIRDRARAAMTDLCQYVDVCISNEEDAKDVFGIEAEATDIYAGEINREGYKSVAKQLADKFGFEKVAITLRAVSYTHLDVYKRQTVNSVLQLENAAKLWI